MRGIFAVFGWPEVGLPRGAWLSADATGTPLALGELGGPREAEGAPPATNERRTVRAVLAGTIYNRHELRASLASRHTLGEGGDAEVLVHLYEERGLQCVKALRGAFSLALWDQRRQRLLLARDQLGLRSLFYAAERDRFVAASELAPLAALPALTAAPDTAALDTYLTLGCVPAPATLYPGIRQLRPGEMAVWEDGRLRTQQYWHLAVPERRMTRGDLPALFRGQIAEVLRLRQTGGVSGMLLSGGVASAAILALAAAEHRPPARAFTVAAPGDGAEVEAAAELAARAGVEHVVVAEPDWPAAVDTLLATHGGPVGGPETPLFAAAAQAAASDLDFLLAGVGAEEIFGGSAPARYAERLRRFRELPGIAREGVEMWTRFAPRQWTATLRRLVADERLAPVEMYARSISVLRPEERLEVYTPEALEALGDTQPWAAVGGLFADAASAGATETADALHFVELALVLPARAEAAAAAAHNFELRFPLADHRLAQFVASVPAAERGTAEQRQLLLRGAVADLVPRSVLERPHAPLAPAPTAWSTGSLRALVEETLAPERLAAQGVFRPDTMARLLHEQAAGAHDHGRLLWAVLLASRWLARGSARPALPIRATG